MAPFFSILIPLYNKERYVANTLESVLAQSFTNFEVVIADDGSTDGSAEIVMAFTDTRIKYYRKENEGVSAARNYAMLKAQGEYFAFLDADDTWQPNHLRLVADAIQKLPHTMVFTTLIEGENSRGSYMPVYTNLKDEAVFEADYFTTSFARSILSGSSTVIHKSIPGKIGEFDTSLSTFEDIDYWIRIGLQYRIGIVNEVTARHRYVPGSLSHTTFSMSDATYFEKFADVESQNPAVKKMIDINRYSLALRCKMAGDKAGFKKLLELMSPKSITLQQQLLLKLPGAALRLLQAVKQYTTAKF